jgi:predicted permease
MIKVALRSLSSARAFSFGIITTLGLCLGGLTAVAAIADAFLAARLPFQNESRIDSFYSSNGIPGFEKWIWSFREFQDLRGNIAPTYDTIAAFTTREFVYQQPERSERIVAQIITGDFFRALGVTPLRGRLIQPGDDRPEGGSKPAVISYRWWTRTFGASQGAIGRSIKLGADVFEIVGVAPRGFELLESNADVWVPYPLHPPSADEQTWANTWIFGLRKPGVSVTASRAAFASWFQHNLEVYPRGKRRPWRPVLMTIHDDLRGKARPTVLIVLTASVCVVLAACANVCGLMLARHRSRQREFAIRSVLGATRRGLVEPLLSESVLLALASVVLGIALAALLTPLLPHLLPAMQDGIPDDEQIALPSSYAIGWRSGLLALTASLTAVLLSSIVPAAVLSRSTQLTGLLRDGSSGAGTSRGAGRLRFCLIAGQTAVACLITTACLLLALAFDTIQSTNTGLDPGNVLTMEITRPQEQSWSEGRSSAALVQFWDRLLAAVRAVPAVQSAAVISQMPFTGDANTGVRILSRAADDGRATQTSAFKAVSPSYFRTLHIPLRGRDFTESDRAGRRPVVIISQSAANTWFGGEDPIGQRISAGIYPERAASLEIVGVAGDVDRPWVGIRPQVYWPCAVDPAVPMDLVVRSAVRPEALESAIRAAVRSTDPSAAVFRVITMKDHLARLIWLPHLGAFVGVLLAVLVLAILFAGISAASADSVALSWRAYGIRLAIGADPSGVVILGLRNALLPVVLGLAIDLAAAIPVHRALSARIVGVPSNAFYWAIAAALLVLAASAIAAWIPARRLRTLDPAVALRQ